MTDIHHPHPMIQATDAHTSVPADWPRPLRATLEPIRQYVAAYCEPPPIYDEHVATLKVPETTLLAVEQILVRRGWLDAVPGAGLPDPMVPASAGLAEVAPEVSWHYDGYETGYFPQEPLTLSDLLLLMKEASVGRPSTWAASLEKALSDGWIHLDKNGHLSLSDRARSAHQRSIDLKLPTLDGAFHQRFQAALDRIESGSTPDDALADILGIFGYPDSLPWLSALQVQGEPAQAVYRRRAQQQNSERGLSLPDFDGLPATVNPEKLMPSDHPEREARLGREQQAESLLGLRWRALSPRQRISVRASLLHAGEPAALEAFRCQHSTDLLVRWRVAMPLEEPALSVAELMEGTAMLTDS